MEVGGATWTTLWILPGCPGLTAALDCSLHTSCIIRLMQGTFVVFWRGSSLRCELRIFGLRRKSIIHSGNNLQGIPIGTPMLGLRLFEHWCGRGLSYRDGEEVGGEQRCKSSKVQRYQIYEKGCNLVGRFQLPLLYPSSFEGQGQPVPQFCWGGNCLYNYPNWKTSCGPDAFQMKIIHVFIGRTKQVKFLNRAARYLNSYQEISK